MPQTAVSLAQVEKEVWTADRLQKQFEDKNVPIGKIAAMTGTMIGRQAQTPVLAGRSGAFTSVGAGGGNLNPPLAQPVAQAFWTLVYNWFQIALDVSALAQAAGNAQSVVGAKDLEIEEAINNTKHQMSRMVMTNGDGIVAAFDTTASATTLNLVNAAGEGANYGYSALVRGWLFSGQPIDIGTTSDSDSLATANVITAVNYTNPAAPTITVTTAVATGAAGTNYAYIPNPNSATAANPELNGLRNIVSTSGALGGLNPATAGQDYWRSAFRDTATTTFSLDLPLNLQRYVLQNSNEPGTAVWTGYRQQANFYALLRQMINFPSEQNLASGNVNRPTWNGMTVDAFADCLDSDWYQLTLPDLIRIKSAIDKPTWASDLEGSGGSTRWVQGTTTFQDGVVWPMQLGCQRRNTHAAATALK